ncbi:MAG TPA: ATP-binding protein [Acidimicrobiales bacterium]|nr:ATP-binding protein [Acidimicrobiales bacterium]
MTVPGLPVESDGAVVLPLPALYSSVTRARHLVRDLLRAWDYPELVEDAELGTSELVANAVRHAGTDLVLTVGAQGGSAGVVKIAVQDGEPELLRQTVARESGLPEQGRGLQIVSTIASEWGVTIVTGGKVVWFQLRAPGAGAGARSPAAAQVRPRHHRRHRVGSAG